MGWLLGTNTDDIGKMKMGVGGRGLLHAKAIAHAARTPLIHSALSFIVYYIAVAHTSH